MLRYLISLLVFGACAPGAAFAAGPGASAADFLNIPVGARETALGGSAAAAEGPVSLAYNPALLSGSDRLEATYSYNNYLPGVSQHWLGAALPAGRGTFAAGLNYLKVAPFPSYDAADNRTGSVSAYDAALYAGYAAALGGRLSAGAALKHISSRLDDKTASGWAADAGLLFAARENVRLGLAGENIVSSQMKFVSAGFKPERKVKAGASYLAGGYDGEVSALLALDLNFPEDGREFVSAGLETSLYRMLALRAGYSSYGDVSSGISFGLGLIMPGAFGSETRLDYSYGSTYDLGETHRFSVTRRFGGEPRAARKTAEKKPVQQPQEIGFDGLLELLYGQHAGASLAAAEHLAKQGDPRALQHFSALLASGKAEWRASGLRGLQLSRDPGAPEALRDLLYGPDPELRISAARVLGERGGAVSAVYLEEALKREESERVKNVILDALIKIRGGGAR